MLSALPNVFPDKVNLQLTGSFDNAAISSVGETSPQTLKSLLAQHDIAVDHIKTSDGMAEILLSDKKQEHVAKQILSNELLSNEVSTDVRLSSEIVSGAPAWLNSLGVKPIKLGLDLSGGVLFVLEVDTEQALSDRLNSIGLEVKSIAMEQRVRGVRVNQADKHSLTINFSKLNEEANRALVDKVIKTYPELTEQRTGEQQYTLSYTEQEQQAFRQETMAQTLKTMRGRIEELGITEAVTIKQGKNRIRIELPGVHNPEEAKRIIGATASLDFYQLAEYSNAAGVIRMTDENGRDFRLNSKVIFSGSNIKNAKAGTDEMGLPLVSLVLDSVGGKKMSNFSKKNVGNPIVTVFSEYYRNAKNEMVKKSKIISVATIQQHLGSQFSITNMSSPQAAQDLSLLLRAGSLSAPVTIVKQRSIEATLGADNIKHGVKALTIGVSFTLLFMAFWYRSLGLVANLALAFNLVSLIGLMSLLPGVVLTLPGIAGLVLTVGMAVDTNVLIFERIKEELRRGRKTLLAIELGYKGAFTTIFDSNITTLITGIILYSIGYGPVKGFAIILCLGIVTSMFTGVFVSKALTSLAIRENKSQLLGVKENAKNSLKEGVKA